MICFFFSKLQQVLYIKWNFFRFGQIFFSRAHTFAVHHEKSFFQCFLRPVLINCLIITLSLEKEIIVLKKVRKKSWIVDPKPVLVNLVMSSKFIHWEVGGRQPLINIFSICCPWKRLTNCRSLILSMLLLFFAELGAVGGMEREPSLDLPLAKVIPIVNGQINHILCDSDNSYFQELFKVGCAREFAANVYEAFSLEID